jgi:hypothetical protein
MTVLDGYYFIRGGSKRMSGNGPFVRFAGNAYNSVGAGMRHLNKTF